ncbi:TPA: type I addiction module toxin, SymE family [Klebsiella oxytoca]|uniref:Type I addiction module toxin, SymE family n=1 Tax=Klebsiella oxytoca TaxID=571 RepID=A0AAN5L5E4_KLEOX|nr:type I addiction module toxin, SymE family [Klebsiella oxytoca]
MRKPCAYTVSDVPNYNGPSTPAINLSGKWFRDAGFGTGTGVTVKIAGNCIVLIPDGDEVLALRVQLKQAIKTVKVEVLNAL